MIFFNDWASKEWLAASRKNDRRGDILGLIFAGVLFALAVWWGWIK